MMNTQPVSQPTTAFDRDPAESWTAALPDDFGALLRDGIDLHVHGQPDVSRRFANRGADIGVARLAHAYGLRGWVLKSQGSARRVAIGPAQAVLTTDVFSRWVPPEPECFRMFAEQLSYLGIPPHDIRQMLVANPRRFLGLAAPA
jgi:hypothetical protein